MKVRASLKLNLTVQVGSANGGVELYVYTGNHGFLSEGPGAFWAGASTSGGVPEVSTLEGA